MIISKELGVLNDDSLFAGRAAADKSLSFAIHHGISHCGVSMPCVAALLAITGFIERSCASSIPSSARAASSSLEYIGIVPNISLTFAMTSLICFLNALREVVCLTDPFKDDCASSQSFIPSFKCFFPSLLPLILVMTRNSAEKYRLILSEFGSDLNIILQACKSLECLYSVVHDVRDSMSVVLSFCQGI